MVDPNARRRLGFDVERFNLDLVRVCNARGISRLELTRRTGVPPHSLYHMTNKRSVPTGTVLATLCKWGGFNLGDYALDLEAA